MGPVPVARVRTPRTRRFYFSSARGLQSGTADARVDDLPGRHVAAETVGDFHRRPSLGGSLDNRRAGASRLTRRADARTPRGDVPPPRDAPDAASVRALAG